MASQQVAQLLDEYSSYYSIDEVRELVAAALRDPIGQIELMCESLRRSFCSQLHEISRIQIFALQALDRPQRFHGEHQIARDYLRIDVPRRRRWLHAALHIVEFGLHENRREFVCGDDATRERLVAWIIQRRGIYLDRGRGKPPLWIELVWG